MCFSPTCAMRPFSSRCRMAWRATDPFTLSLSLTTEGVISLAFGISFIILSYVALPLLHFFFLERPPAMAAFIFASFDFCTTLLAPMAPRRQQHHRESLPSQ